MLYCRAYISISGLLLATGPFNQISKQHSNMPMNMATEKLKKQPLATNDEQSQLKNLIAKGKEQGFLTYAEVSDHLPDDIVDPEQIEDIINMIDDMGIKVYESPPDPDSIVTDSAEGT